MVIWKEGTFLGSWYAELGNRLNLKVFYNPIDPDRPYQVRVFDYHDYHTIWAATLEEAKQAAERTAREILLQALAALDAKNDGKDGER